MTLLRAACVSRVRWKAAPGARGATRRDLSPPRAKGHARDRVRGPAQDLKALARRLIENWAGPDVGCISFLPESFCVGVDGTSKTVVEMGNVEACFGKDDFH